MVLIGHGVQSRWADHHQVVLGVGEIDHLNTREVGTPGFCGGSAGLTQVQQSTSTQDLEGIHASAARDQIIRSVINDGVITITSVDDVGATATINGLRHVGAMSQDHLSTTATGDVELHPITHNLVDLADFQSKQNRHRRAVAGKVGVAVVGDTQHLLGATRHPTRTGQQHRIPRIAFHNERIRRPRHVSHLVGAHG